MQGKKKNARYNADIGELRRIAEQEVLNLHGMFHDKNTLLDEYIEFFIDMNEFIPEKFIEELEIDVQAKPLEEFWLKSYSEWDMKSKDEFMGFAKEKLDGKSFGSVDGSQIYSHYILNVPVGLIRVYGVNMSYDGKTPVQEFNEYEGINPYQDPGVEDMKEYHHILRGKTVDYFRNILEHKMECKLILEEPDYVFTDNPLILSFLELPHLKPYKRGYLDSILLALCYSEKYKVPLFGFLERPKTTDLAKIIKIAKEESGAMSENDLYNKDPLEDNLILDGFLKRYDRTCVFQSHQRIVKQYRGIINLNLERDGKNNTREEVDFREELCFYYTRVSPRSILRVEFPKWVLDQSPNAIEEIHEMIVAQCILGQGYPYVVNLAHEKAVLRTIGSDFFINCAAQKARELKFGLSYSAKELNKKY